MKRVSFLALAFVLVMAVGSAAMPQKAEAFYETRKTGNKVDLYYQSKIAKNDSYRLRAVYTGPIDPDNNGDYSIRWVWSVCGNVYRSTDVDNGKTTDYTYKFGTTGSCRVYVKAIYTENPRSSSPVITQRSAVAFAKVLPVYSTSVSISGAPPTAKVGQVFWMSSSYKGTYEYIKWDWRTSGACKGVMTNYNPETKIGETGDSVGTCKVKLTLNVYQTDRVLRKTVYKQVPIVK